MNRRNFLFGGGIIGVVVATFATVKRTSQPQGSVSICEGSHTPHEEFMKHPAYGMELAGKETQAIIPCKKCGMLFAMKTQHADRFGIVAQGG